MSDANRYIRSAPGEAVWVSGEGQPSPEDIPACKACGGPRQLEFQILPQVGLVNADVCLYRCIYIYICIYRSGAQTFKLGLRS